jgi:hypothetical protein
MARENATRAVQINKWANDRDVMKSNLSNRTAIIIVKIMIMRAPKPIMEAIVKIETNISIFTSLRCM